jgi:hypothetical protein
VVLLSSWHDVVIAVGIGVGGVGLFVSIRRPKLRPAKRRSVLREFARTVGSAVSLRQAAWLIRELDPDLRRRLSQVKATRTALELRFVPRKKKERKKKN